jgi:hypothetical protein
MEFEVLKTAGYASILNNENGCYGAATIFGILNINIPSGMAAQYFVDKLLKFFEKTKFHIDSAKSVLE